MTGETDKAFKPRDGTPSLSIIRFFADFHRLKSLYRQGWLDHGVSKEQCESVAEHSFGVALLALVFGNLLPTGVDREKVLRMALIHDMGEIDAGDIVPRDNIASEKKHAQEKRSVFRVFRHLPQGEAFIALWQEYAANKTPEARWVKELDRLEMALQAVVYKNQETGADLEEFLDSAESDISIPELADILRQLRKEWND